MTRSSYKGQKGQNGGVDIEREIGKVVVWRRMDVDD
jgi:hypothetical protein